MAFGKPTYKKTWTKIVAKDLSPCRVRIEEVMVKKRMSGSVVLYWGTAQGTVV